MLVVVSPAKNLDFTSPLPSFLDNSQNKAITPSQPMMMDNVKTLVEKCKTLSPADLSSLMKISDKLAILNAERFSSFEFPFTNKNARPAMYAFNGDVYAGLDAHTLNEEDVEFANAHMRILSGLYGSLKPMDLMQPYRLEMGTKLALGEATNLYQYWHTTITHSLNCALHDQCDDVLVNLASNEYFSSVNKSQLKAQIITPVFKDEKNGKFKIISFYAKKARGLMARYIIEHKISSVEGLKAFNVEGYYFDQTDSTNQELVFKRAQR